MKHRGKSSVWWLRTGNKPRAASRVEFGGESAAFVSRGVSASLKTTGVDVFTAGC